MQKNVKYFDLMKVHMLILLKNVIYEMHHLRDASSTRYIIYRSVIDGLHHVWYKLFMKGTEI